MIKINILPKSDCKKDIDVVAKIILIDKSKRVLFLKRSDYMTKFAGEWDLPGGHLMQGESLIEGLKREVLEETHIKISNETFLKNIENLHFFYANYNSQPVKLSDEHTEYKFFEKSELDLEQKFQKVAFLALESKK